MHLSSLDKMKTFRERYLSGKEDIDLTIFDLGSRAIGGSYREIFSEKRWHYIGIDLIAGENVNMVLSDPYNWLEIDTDSADVFISGQTFEHIEFFWATMREIARVLKPGGLCCIIAPSSGPEHKYPVDCWRFYPDAFRALSRYADLELLEVNTQWEPEDYTDGSDMWKDTMFVGRKPAEKPKGINDTHIYQREIKEDSEDSLTKIIRYIASHAKVLELGPATGYMTRILAENLGCSVDCVEISAKMAKEAEKYSDRMVVADLNTLVLEEEFQEESYDYIILADVLEHLMEGERTLTSCRKLLKKNGQCIISIPNIAHASIIGDLLRGRFEYTTEGLLDHSHVKFFTRTSIQRLLHQCGFNLENIEAVLKLPEDTEIGDSLMRLPVEVQRAIFAAPESLAYQFVIVCSPAMEQPSELQTSEPLYHQQVVDLRRLVISDIEQRLARTHDELQNARKFAYERLENIKQLEDAYKQLEDAFHKAEALAFEHLARVSELEKRIQELQQTLGYRVWKKVRGVLGSE